MCGIGGATFLALDDARQVGHAMTDALRHRGPDARGVMTLTGGDGRAAGVLAHTRLRIIDLSERAAQPFTSEDGQVHLVFNGEIYGFRRLRARLEREGVRFRSDSDTEVVLAQYLHHGVAGLEALDGMFAFAIWDARHDRLVLMRDRVGKKPLYWAEHEGGLLFASEAKALRAVPGFQLALDPERIPEFLTFGYVTTPQSIFRGVHRLPPGHRLVREGRGAVRIEPYWDLLTSTRAPLPVDAREAQGLVRDAVGRAVERRLVADVPVGAFLSGGVDSSVVVAEMAARSSGEVRTFAVGFDDDATFDETRYARDVAQQFGTTHTELRLKPRAEELFDRLLWHHDEPYGDSSAL
ncbi:MAG: asparagine synthase (glutamine-hydrolyzing), partial [Myxococcota bacterium]